MSKSLIIDIRMIRSGGIGTYIREVVPGLTQNLAFRRLRLLVVNKAEFESNFAAAFGSVNYEVLEIPARIYSPQEQWGYLKSSSGEFDLFWAPHLNLPWFFPNTLVTLHDTFHLSRPDVSRFHERVYMRLALQRIKAHAKAVIAVSNFSKAEALRYMDYPADKIHVIPHAYSKPMVPPKADYSQFPRDKKFVLFVGNLKPHKNLKTLVKAFSSIKDQFPHELWIAGHQEGMRTVDQDLDFYRRELGERLRFLGRVGEDELAYLYKKASVFVAPSTYEGFGLTPIEALASGARVIASDIPAHREFMPEGPAFFDPSRVDLLASLLKENLLEGASPAKFDLSRSWSQVIEEHRRVFDGLGF